MRVDGDDPVVALACRACSPSSVVDDVVGAERPDEVELRPAGDAGDLGAHRLRDLDRERADVARGAVDRGPGRPGRIVRPFRLSERPGARGRPSAAAWPRSRSSCPSGIGEEGLLGRRDVLGERALPNGNRSANTRSPGLNRVDVRPDRLDDARRRRGRRRGSSARGGRRTAGRTPSAGTMPSRSARLTDAAWTRTRTSSPVGDGLLHLPDLDDLRRAVAVAHGCSHRVHWIARTRWAASLPAAVTPLRLAPRSSRITVRAVRDSTRMCDTPMLAAPRAEAPSAEVVGRAWRRTP